MDVGVGVGVDTGVRTAVGVRVAVGVEVGGTAGVDTGVGGAVWVWVGSPAVAVGVAVGRIASTDALRVGSCLLSAQAVPVKTSKTVTSTRATACW